MTLDEAQLIRITKREKPTAQARILRLLSIPFRIHPVDGNLIVSTAAVEQALGVPLEVATQEPEEVEINLAGIRQYGKEKATR